MIIRDGMSYGYDPTLGGFFSKARKLVKKSVKITNMGHTFARKKVAPKVIPKKVRAFGSRAWKNPYVKAAATAIATWGVGLVAAPLIGAAAVAQAKNIKTGIDAVKGVKAYKKGKRAKRRFKLEQSLAKAQYLPAVEPAALATMTPTAIFAALSANPQFTALSDDVQAQVFDNVQADAAKARTAVAAIKADEASPDSGPDEVPGDATNAPAVMTAAPAPAAAWIAPAALAALFLL